MRLLFASDFHGRLEHYDALRGLVACEQPELLILGGDMFPDGDEDDPVGSQQAFVRGRFRQFLEQYRQDAADMRIACVLGNHDWAPVLETVRQLEAEGLLTLLVPQRTAGIGGWKFVGYWHTPPTPFWLKDFERLDRPGDAPPDPQQVSRIWDAAAGAVRTLTAGEYFLTVPTIADELAQLEPMDERTIFVCHAPPGGTRLDRLTKDGYPIGSFAVRDALPTLRPRLALHGHVHESPGATGVWCEQVAGIPCFNPGQSERELYALLLDARDPVGSARHTVLP